MRSATVVTLAAALAAMPGSQPVRAESLAQAWALALGLNQGLQAQQAESIAQGLNLAAARSARLPTVRSFAFESFLTATPAFKGTLPGQAGTGSGSSAATAGIPFTFPVLGPGQRQLPASFTFAAVPLFTGGKIAHSIEAAGARVNAQRTEEFRSALDLKLAVAEAYVGVLRSRKDLEVARSNVARLAAFARDVRNRREQGMAIRSDDLAAEVSLANARLGEIQAQTANETAWATYNRYVCRPLDTVVDLDELSNLPSGADWQALAAKATERRARVGDENEARALTEQALRSRPELAGLAEQARALGEQAEATRAGLRPQVAAVAGYGWLGNNIQSPQAIGTAAFVVDWTITDGGASRRRAAALQQQECASLKKRADLAADIALQVRTRWLALQQARLRIPVARLAIAQAEENVNVVTDRYRQQLSTYTEVLDAENRRVQSLTNFYNALYDESLALFRLRRAVGDL
jgi:outer membrane protein TolC